jgi:DNA-binding response OmpR family regulator
MTDKQDFQKKIGAIGQNFLLKLKADLPFLEKFSDHSKVAKIKEEDQNEAAKKMHKIAGSAKIFGFEKLGNFAAAVENNFKNKIRPSEAFADFLQEAKSIVESKLKTQKKISLADEGKKKFKYCAAIAEDDDVARELAKQALQELDCKILEAKDGVEILKKIKNSSDELDLIILAINMPKKNGFEVLEALKKNSATKEIPVVMLAQKIDSDDVLRGMSSGAIDYITQPFETENFKKRIGEILQNFRQKILVADDDELIHDVLSEHFRRLGYLVLSAKNGKEALEIIAEQKPNIVILDYMMPALDGIAVLKKMKSNPEISDIPVVMLTVKSQQENILQGLKSGANDYVTKPFDIEELSQRVIGILKRY